MTRRFGPWREMFPFACILNSLVADDHVRLARFDLEDRGEVALDWAARNRGNRRGRLGRGGDRWRITGRLCVATNSVTWPVVRPRLLDFVRVDHVDAGSRPRRVLPYAYDLGTAPLAFDQQC
jgi:hypothetical protein